jgi:sugar phosphate isomerase/epimerase
MLPILTESATSEYGLGIATTSYLTAWRPKDTYEFLEHCHTLGAAGIQSAIHGDIPKIRARAEQFGMYIEAMVQLPKGSDTTAFEQSLKNAKEVGAAALRSACLGSRRYETFSSLADWQAHVAESHQAIEAAIPLLEKYKIPLGIENHKDWTADEMVALQKKYASEYFGVCLDFGNNLALLDDPMDVIEKLAPYTVTTHVKNMAVEPGGDNTEGFLLSEVLLGDGYLDLPRAIRMLQQARPKAHFLLEMITRDPLKVPCLTDKYWVTFPDRSGLYLARTLRFVDTHESAKPLPRVSQLTHEEQMRVEDENVIACLKWARTNLAL